MTNLLFIAISLKVLRFNFSSVILSTKLISLFLFHFQDLPLIIKSHNKVEKHDMQNYMHIQFHISLED